MTLRKVRNPTLENPPDNAKMDETEEGRVEGEAEKMGDFALAGWVRLAAICRNGPDFRKPWRSGIKACVEFLYPIVHVWFSGSRAALH